MSDNTIRQRSPYKGVISNSDTERDSNKSEQREAQVKKVIRRGAQRRQWDICDTKLTATL